MTKEELANIEPDMWWDKDNPEDGGHYPEDINDGGPGAIVEVMCALELSNRFTVRVRTYEDGDEQATKVVVCRTRQEALDLSNVESIRDRLVKARGE